MRGEVLARTAAVRDRKMREDALRHQAGQPAGRGDLRHGRSVPVDVLKVKAEAAHARVHLDVDLDRDAAAHRVFGKRRAVRRRIRALRDVVFRKLTGRRGRRIAEHEQRQGNARAAKLQRLLDVGDGEPVCAERLVFARETHRAVAVGVGLDDAAHHRLPADPPADLLEVVRHGVQIDLGPRSFLHNIHNKTPY